MSQDRPSLKGQRKSTTRVITFGDRSGIVGFMGVGGNEKAWHD